jgi:LPS export ABC transporter protein LptC
VPDNSRKNVDFRIRAKLPQYFRIGALAAIAATIGIVILGFYRERNKPTFHLKSEHTQLSNEVVAEVAGYERLETDGEVPKYFVKADKARTYSDNHQELENLFIQTYDQSGNPADKMKADKGLYIPEEDKNFTAYLSGAVNIETRDALKLATNHIVYTRKNETAEADEPVQFERENIKGKSQTAIVRVAEKQVELRRDVEIDMMDVSGQDGDRQGTLKAAWASYDQSQQRIDVREDVNATVIRKENGGRNQTITASSDRATAFVSSADGGDPRFNRLELLGNISLDSSEEGGSTTKINSGYANYDKLEDRFDLRDAVHIITSQNAEPADIKASEAVYWQTAGKVELNGGAEISQGINYTKGDHLSALLNAERRLKSCSVKGNSFLRQSAAERITQVSADELGADFSEDAKLQSANGSGDVAAELLPAQPSDYSKVRMTTPRAIRLSFKGEGLLDQMRTEGRTTIKLSVPDNETDAANKQVTADSVITYFDESGKNLKKAEAVGNSELFVEPLRASPDNYRTVVRAPRFDCEFFATGNNAKFCLGGTKTTTVRTPTVKAEGRGEQSLTADKISAEFSERNKDVESLDATGDVKFSELDRSAVASTMRFSQGDKVVRLRGGEPTAWDASARVKAAEIDWDTANQRSSFRGGVSTTYYSRRQMNDAAPFGSSDKPVFVTAENAEFDHRQNIGIYSGNARGRSICH